MNFDSVIISYLFCLRLSVNVAYMDEYPSALVPHPHINI